MHACRSTLEDPTGNAPLSSPPDAAWFTPNGPRKGSAFTLAPSTTAAVFQDEFANAVANRWGGAGIPIHFSLDNEPDLWADTHAEIQRVALRYDALVPASIESASAIKDAVPSSLIFGPASFGWSGYLNLQSAPDAGGRDFLGYYLDQFKAAEASKGKRLLDVLDLHFYSEAYGCGTRVVSTTSNNSDCVVAARVQSSRSLADATYVEPSWITGCCSTDATYTNGAIALLPRMLAKIAARYPSTRLAVTEYNFGGSDHVSGAVAQADALGAYGRGGAFAASYWSMLGDDSWAFAAWRAYRNYDGAGAHFPDASIPAASTDLRHVSAWAAVDAAANRVVVVLINRPGAVTNGSNAVTGIEGNVARTVKLQIAHPSALGTVKAWQLSSGASPAWKSVAATVSGNAVTLALPALSVTTVELKP